MYMHDEGKVFVAEKRSENDKSLSRFIPEIISYSCEDFFCSSCVSFIIPKIKRQGEKSQKISFKAL
jgi:hypothetical protein